MCLTPPPCPNRQPFLWRWQLTCRELGLDALPSHIKEDAQGLIRLYEIRAMHT